jgi:hypothetical protein
MLMMRGYFKSTKGGEDLSEEPAKGEKSYPQKVQVKWQKKKIIFGNDTYGN